MKSRSLRHARTAPSAHRQRGVYAIEYALVFLIFFGLVYAIICYGILFTFRFGLQNAAEDGARAALRYQSSIGARKAEAARVTGEQIKGWLPALACPSTGTPAVPSCVTATIEPSEASCGATWDKRCRVVVTVTAGALGQVLPPFPRVAMPAQLTVQARVLLDGRSL